MSELLLDCRSRSSRQVQNLWTAWEDNTPGWLPPIARLGERFLERNLSARILRRGSPPAHPLILSIGNLVSGGTGKTPVVMKLARELSAEGRSGAILTRGYGSRNTGPVIVDPLDRSCGDEARMAARNLPDWRVVQSRDRQTGLAWLMEHLPDTPTILVEDGHQTAGVPRHLDILLLDRWRLQDRCIEPLTGHRLPWGPYRESASGADRAGIWIIRYDDTLATDVRGRNDAEILQVKRRLLLPDPLPATRMRYGLISGIARPESFESDCRRLLGHPPEIVARFDDHADYTSQLLQPVLDAGAERGIDTWLTTEKDQVKLDRDWPADLTLISAKLSLDWVGGKSLARIALSLIEGDNHEHG